MKYELILRIETPAGESRAMVFYASDDPKCLDLFNAAKAQWNTKGPKFISRDASKPGQKGKPVSVISVEFESEFSGSHQPGMVFESATEFAESIGVPRSSVLSALYHAKKKGDTETTIKSITFCYTDSLAGKVD